MMAFGWSAGDIAIAVQILYRILKAFDRAKGAKKQYALSCGFLRQLIPVIKRIQLQIKESEDEEFQSDLAEQFEAVNAAYEEFDYYLQKKYGGLSAKEPSRATQILKTVQWSLDDLHDKVQKFKDRVNDALQVYQARMLQEIFNKVDNLDLAMQDSSTEHSSRLDETTAAMKEVQEQLELYQEFSKDAQQYQEALTEDLKQQQHDGTSAIRGDLANMRTEMNANHEKQLQIALAEARSTEDSRSQLVQCQKDIVGIIERQQSMAQSQTEEAAWNRLQVQAKEEAQASENASNVFQNNLGNASEGMSLVSDKTNNEHVKKGLDEVNYATKWVGFLGKTGFFSPKTGSSDRPSQSANTTSSPAPRPRASTVAPPTAAPSAIQHRSRPSTTSVPSIVAPPSRPIERNMPPPPPRQSAGASKSLSNPWGANVSLSRSPPPRNPSPRRDSGIGTPERESRPPLPTRPTIQAQSPPALPVRPVNQTPTSPPLPSRPPAQAPVASPPLPSRSPATVTTASPPSLKPKPQTLRTVSSSNNAPLTPPVKPESLQRTISSPATNPATKSALVGLNRPISNGVTSPPSGEARVEEWIMPDQVAKGNNNGFGTATPKNETVVSSSVRQRARMFEGSPVMGQSMTR